MLVLIILLIVIGICCDRYCDKEENIALIKSETCKKCKCGKK